MADVMLGGLAIGKRFTGRVNEVTETVAFVDIGVVHRARLHSSDMKYNPPKDLRSKLSVDDELDVYVKRISPDGSEVGLTMRVNRESGPGDLSAFRHLVGRPQFIKGIAKRSTGRGMFVRVALPSGAVAEGYCGVLCMCEPGTGRRSRSVKDMVDIGDEIDVRVHRIDTRKGLMLLSMQKHPYFDGDPSLLDDWDWDVPFNGTVLEVDEKGVVVQVRVGEDADDTLVGRVTLKSLSENFLDSALEAGYTQGDRIRVWISSIRNGRVYFAAFQREIKPLPDLRAFQYIEPDVWLDGTVTGIADEGVRLMVASPDRKHFAEGFLTRDYMSDGFGFQRPVKEDFDYDQELQVRIVGVAHGDMLLTMRAVDEAPVQGADYQASAKREAADYPHFVDSSRYD